MWGFRGVVVEQGGGFGTAVLGALCTKGAPSLDPYRPPLSHATAGPLTPPTVPVIKGLDTGARPPGGVEYPMLRKGASGPAIVFPGRFFIIGPAGGCQNWGSLLKTPAETRFEARMQYCVI